MIKEIMKMFKKAEGYENVKTPENTVEKFLLNYNNFLIGELFLKQGKWKFSYSDDFKNQDKIKPLFAFPVVNKLYESNELWPFFFTRIPSLNQPEIKEKIKSQNIDETSEVELLKMFGHKTITDPFELTVS